MADSTITKEHLLQRREEIREQIAKLDKDIHVELDRDPEEQAIQLEQHEVTVGLLENLHRELVEIEDKLLDFED